MRRYGPAFVRIILGMQIMIKEVIKSHIEDGSARG